LAAELDRFPFAGDLIEATGGSRDAITLTRALVGYPGLGFSQLPKGLIPFHAYPDGARTPLLEHIEEARLYGAQVPRLTLTVSPEHRGHFEDALAGLKNRCQVDLTEQSPTSRTLAYDAERSDVVRDRDGLPVLRPGGHGALLENLLGSSSRHLFVRNIDNIQPKPTHQHIADWKRTLGGIALDFSERISSALQAIKCKPEELKHGSIERLLGELGISAAQASMRDAHHWIQLLDRPLRVCGVVRNEGEPGGGPFWVRLPNGEVRPQIVESAEVAVTDPAQAEIWRSATHFNPVDMACVIGRPDGSRYRLDDYCDRSAVFITERSINGHPVRALERPGLWNGSMAYWHTVFVEVPASTFAPVKSVFDLLRPEHQPQAS